MGDPPGIFRTSRKLSQQKTGFLRSLKLFFIVNMVVMFLHDLMLVLHEISQYKNSLHYLEEKLHL